MGICVVGVSDEGAGLLGLVFISAAGQPQGGAHRKWYERSVCTTNTNPDRDRE